DENARLEEEPLERGTVPGHALLVTRPALHEVEDRPGELPSGDAAQVLDRQRAGQTGHRDPSTTGGMAGIGALLGGPGALGAHRAARRDDTIRGRGGGGRGLDPGVG